MLRRYGMNQVGTLDCVILMVTLIFKIVDSYMYVASEAGKLEQSVIWGTGEMAERAKVFPPSLVV